MRKIFIIAFAALSAFSCDAEDDDKEWLAKANQQIAERIKSYELLPGVLRIIQAAESTTVFEGMPHQEQESKLLEKELAITDELMIGGFAFYPEPHELLKSDRPTLAKFLNIEKGFHVYTGPAWCGGFHPDYAIRFKSGDQTYDLLLCFGCGEARIQFGDKVIFCDIPRKEWKELLAGYAKFRPDPEPALDARKK